MKRSLIFVVIIAFIFSLCGCISYEDHIVGTPMLKVKLKSYNKEDNKKISYYIVDDKGHGEKTNKFEPDENVTIFNADACTDFNCEIVNGKNKNKLIETKGKDEQGNSVIADETTAEIMEIAANTIDHVIYEFSVWCIEDKYFVFLKLNVNWQDPCTLYFYDTTDEKLEKLYTWQSRDLIGISTDVK